MHSGPALSRRAAHTWTMLRMRRCAVAPAALGVVFQRVRESIACRFCQGPHLELGAESRTAPGSLSLRALWFEGRFEGIEGPATSQPYRAAVRTRVRVWLPSSPVEPRNAVRALPPSDDG